MPATVGQLGRSAAAECDFPSRRDLLTPRYWGITVGRFAACHGFPAERSHAADN
jgi:hypothetical protein